MEKFGDIPGQNSDEFIIHKPRFKKINKNSVVFSEKNVHESYKNLSVIEAPALKLFIDR